MGSFLLKTIPEKLFIYMQYLTFMSGAHHIRLADKEDPRGTDYRKIHQNRKKLGDD